MPRYYFHTLTDRRTKDSVGLELPGDTEARAQAIRGFGEMVGDAPEGFWGSRPWCVSVTDAAGRLLYEIYIDGYASPNASRPSAP